MNYIKSCEFNIDTACIEVKLIDGSMVSIDCDIVEAEYVRNMYEATELDYLIYNDPRVSSGTKNTPRTSECSRSVLCYFYS